MLFDQLELTLIVASLDTSDITIEESLTRALDDTLRTREDGRIVIQEVYPEVDIAPVRLLVGDVADNHRASLVLVFHDMAQRLLHRDADTAEALADIEEQTIEIGILDGMVQFGTDTLVADG